jgi:hypothetical protein
LIFSKFDHHQIGEAILKKSSPEAETSVNDRFQLPFLGLSTFNFGKLTAPSLKAPRQNAKKTTYFQLEVGFASMDLMYRITQQFSQE